MSFDLVPTLFEPLISNELLPQTSMSREDADKVFEALKNQPLIDWEASNNFCEARAEAVSILLRSSNVVHAKAWVFSGAFLYWGNVGNLKNYWNYHVAIVLPVQGKNDIEWWVADPSLSKDGLMLVYHWAAEATAIPHSYYGIKPCEYYIFPDCNILTMQWHKSDRQNFEWTVEGLAGINGLTYTGKAQKAFLKPRIEAVRKKFFDACEAYKRNPII